MIEKNINNMTKGELIHLMKGMKITSEIDRKMIRRIKLNLKQIVSRLIVCDIATELKNDKLFEKKLDTSNDLGNISTEISNITYTISQMLGDKNE